MLLWANPYSHLDHRGRLAGACPQAEPLHIGEAIPLRRYVGADRKMTDGSYIKENHQIGRESNADTFWTFSPEPVAPPLDHSADIFYRARAKEGEVIVADGEDLPIDALARARARAIKTWFDSYGAEPDQSTWETQYELDPIVAVRMHEVIEEDEKKATTKAAETPEQKKAREVFEAEEAKRQERIADRKKAVDEAKAKLASRKAAPKEAVSGETAPTAFAVAVSAAADPKIVESMKPIAESVKSGGGGQKKTSKDEG